MPYLIGAALAVVVALMAKLLRLDRERGWYPAVLIVISSYYDLFAVISGSAPVLGLESTVLSAFTGLAISGLRSNLWLVVAGLCAHGLFDMVHGGLIQNSGVPAWWPGFCLSFDFTAAGCLALLLRGKPAVAATPCCDTRSPEATCAKAPSRSPVLTLLTAVALGVVGCQSAPPADTRIATLNDHRVAYRVLGHDRPALVMISGLGDGMATFSAVAPQLAQGATVIVYDRAGYGGSSRAFTTQDAAAADRELIALLRACGVPGPYILLGHSLGGLFAEHFAAHHPELVAGLILEESRPADFAARCQAAGGAMCSPPAAMALLAPQGAQAELAALPQTEAQVAALPAPPASATPVLVLSRPPAPANASPFDTAWTQSQIALATRHHARRLTAPSGGHDIHHDQPAWFVAQVREFMAEVEARRRR